MQYETPVKSYSFDSFVPFPGNMTAVQMAILMAENGNLSSGEALLYVYGDRGVGKTHLLNAIANAAVKYDTILADVKKLLRRCEEKWEKGERVDLAERLIDPDLLLLDNIDASAEHEQFQAGLFDLIENRLSAGLGVIGASRVPPSGLKVLHSEYENLFGSGKIVKLDWADAECRAQILQNLVGPGNVPDVVLGAILSKGIEDGHTLKDWALGLRAKTEITRLLTQLGYSPANVRRTTTDRGEYLISQWRLELEGRTHVADVAYSLSSRSVVTRCWSPLQN